MDIYELRKKIDSLVPGKWYFITHYNDRRMKFLLNEFDLMSHTINYTNEKGVQDFYYNVQAHYLMTIEEA